MSASLVEKTMMSRVNLGPWTWCFILKTPPHHFASPLGLGLALSTTRVAVFAPDFFIPESITRIITLFEVVPVIFNISFLSHRHIPDVFNPTLTHSSSLSESSPSSHSIRSILQTERFQRLAAAPKAFSGELVNDPLPVVEPVWARPRGEHTPAPRSHALGPRRSRSSCPAHGSSTTDHE